MEVRCAAAPWRQVPWPAAMGSGGCWPCCCVLAGATAGACWLLSGSKQPGDGEPKKRSLVEVAPELPEPDACDDSWEKVEPVLSHVSSSGSRDKDVQFQPSLGRSSTETPSFRSVEVERSIFLSELQLRRLHDDLQPHAEASFVDTYYDSPGYALTLREHWLRQRDTVWELKVAWNASGSWPGQALKRTQAYEELTEPAAILRRLRAAGLLSARPATEVGLAAALEAEGIQPFAILATQRTSLRSSAEEAFALGVAAVKVNIDVVSFDVALPRETADLRQRDSDARARSFNLAEIEVVVHGSPDAVSKADGAIDLFCLEHGCQDAHEAHSKLLEYMARFRPTHLAALTAAGVVPAVVLEETVMQPRARVAHVGPPAFALRTIG